MRGCFVVFLALVSLLVVETYSFSSPSPATTTRHHRNDNIYLRAAIKETEPLVFSHEKDDEKTRPVAVAVSSDDENDSSRRQFVAGVIGLGFFVAGMESANAIVDTTTTSTSSSSTVDSLSSSSTMMADATAAAAAAANPVDFNAIVQKASKRALGGGKAGASAAVVQVCSLMWLRTSMNYQVKYIINIFYWWKAISCIEK